MKVTTKQPHKARILRRSLRKPRDKAKVEIEGPRPSEEAVYRTFEDADRTTVLGEADTIDIFDPITGEAHAVKLFVAAMDIWTVVRLGLTCANSRV
jgi:hypothetical protein